LWFVVCGLWFVVCGLWFAVRVLFLAKRHCKRVGGIFKLKGARLSAMTDVWGLGFGVWGLGFGVNLLDLLLKLHADALFGV